MRLNTRPRLRNSGKADAWKRVPGFLKWLRGRECFLADRGGCRGKVRACHFDPNGDKGMSTKVNDRASLPMCDGHHEEQTDVLGWPAFQAKYRFDGKAVCAQYYLQWPGRRAWDASHPSEAA